MNKNKHRKGVTPVIATVLLITIAIAAVSSAAVFLTDITEELREGVEDQLTEEERIQQTDINIEAGYQQDGDIHIEIRNTGSMIMPVRENDNDLWSIFVDGEPNNSWEYQDTDIEDEEEYNLNENQLIVIDTNEEFPSGDSKIIEVNAPGESSSTILCDDVGDQTC